MQMNYKKGDFVATDSGAWIFIVKEPIADDCAYMYASQCGVCLESTRGWFSRFATPEERERLLDAIMKQGYSWDEETLELVKEL